MGSFLSRGCPEGPIHFLVPQFLCSTWAARFFIPTLTSESPARAEAVKDWRVSATEGLVLRRLRARRHTCCGVGDDDIEGSPRVVHDCSCHMYGPAVRRKAE